MLFTGRRLNATEALSHGLIARVVTHDELRAETDRVLQDLLLSAPRARTALKRPINARYGSVDKITFDESLAGDEVIEGFTAFVEKRSPSWASDELGASGRV